MIGVPSQDVHRSQSDTPPTSSQKPVMLAMNTKKPTASAGTILTTRRFVVLML
jgi:hypothetical protein